MPLLTRASCPASLGGSPVRNPSNTPLVTLLHNALPGSGQASLQETQPDRDHVGALERLEARSNSLRQIANRVPLGHRSRRNRTFLVMSPEPSDRHEGDVGVSGPIRAVDDDDLRETGMDSRQTRPTDRPAPACSVHSSVSAAAPAAPRPRRDLLHRPVSAQRFQRHLSRRLAPLLYHSQTLSCPRSVLDHCPVFRDQPSPNTDTAEPAPASGYGSDPAITGSAAQHSAVARPTWSTSAESRLATKPRDPQSSVANARSCTRTGRGLGSSAHRSGRSLD